MALPCTSILPLRATLYLIHHAPKAPFNPYGRVIKNVQVGSFCSAVVPFSQESEKTKPVSLKDSEELLEKETYVHLDGTCKHIERQNMAKMGSRQEFYIREDEIKSAKSTGIGIGDEGLEEYLMNALLSNSSNGNTLCGMKISLFDLHSIRLAERLLNSGVSSLSIIETSQNEAQKAKEYAGKIRKKHGLLVRAYRASMESLFPLCTRKKQTSFPSKLLFASEQLMKESIHPLSLISDAFQNEDESGDNRKFAPQIIGSLPTANEQSNMLTSLVYTLITHLCGMKRDTMFQFGAVQLITFLSASNFALAVCALDPNMQFVSSGNRHKSWLLNKLFTIRPISGYSGFPRSAFIPPFPIPKSFPFEQKFKLIGITNENLYGIVIKPKSVIRIGNLNLVSNFQKDDCDAGTSAPAEIIMKYAFWIIFTSKMTSKTVVVRKLREWFPKTKICPMMEPNAKVADLMLEDFDKIFCVLYNEMNENFTLKDELRNFCAQFRPTNMDTRFAD